MDHGEGHCTSDQGRKGEPARSGALRGCYRPLPDGSYQCGVVGFGLVSVGPRELGHGPIQLVGSADIARDHGSATGAGVPLGQQATDDAGIVGQRRGIDGVERMVPFMFRNCRT